MIRFDTKKDLEYYDNLHRKMHKKDREIERLNNIIDKAIEYIHNHQLVFKLSSKKQIQEWFEEKYYVDLLNILKGECK